MEELFTRVWENLISRTEGPLNLRFYIQPAISIFFTIRAGLADARQGAVPYLWRFLVSKGKRTAIVKEGWSHVGKVFIMGVTLDVVYQLIALFKTESQTYFYPLESVIVAIALAIVPYLLLRGPISRLVTLIYKQKHPQEPI
jgi:hypothetical protein